MFASSASRNASTAYRQVGVETGVSSASPHQLVVLLFDGFFDAVAQARGSLQAGHIQEKGRAIGKAVRIIEEGLKASLNLKDGGEIAANLHQLYTFVALRLTEANLHNDTAALEQCARLIEPVRSAWKSIDPANPARPQ